MKYHQPYGIFDGFSTYFGRAAQRKESFTTGSFPIVQFDSNLKP